MAHMPGSYPKSKTSFEGYIKEVSSYKRLNWLPINEQVEGILYAAGPTFSHFHLHGVREGIQLRSYIFNDNTIGNLPDELSFLFEDFNKSLYILNLKDDWDDEGAKGYEEITWISAIKFLINYSKSLYRDFNIRIASPKIYHGPKGSIDIIWETENYRLVVNIEKEGNKAMFYADNYNDQIVEGSFHIDNFVKNLLPIALKF